MTKIQAFFMGAASVLDLTGGECKPTWFQRPSPEVALQDYFEHVGGYLQHGVDEVTPQIVEAERHGQVQTELPFHLSERGR